MIHDIFRCFCKTFSYQLDSSQLRARVFKLSDRYSNNISYYLCRFMLNRSLNHIVVLLLLNTLAIIEIECVLHNSP